MVDASSLRTGLTRRAFIERNAQAGGLLVVSGGLAALLEACGDDSEQSAAGVSQTDIESASGQINVLGWSFYEVPAQNASGVDGKWTALSSVNEIPTKIRSGNAFDVVTTTTTQMPQMIALDRLVPVDPALVPNYDKIAPSLQQDDVWKGPDGEVLAVPFAITVAPFLWDSSQVAEPTTLEDLLRPEYEQSIAILDDFQEIRATARGLGLEFQQMTHDDLDQTMAFLEDLRPQVKTLAQFGEEVQLFGRGDIAVYMWSSGGSLMIKDQKVNPGVKGSFLGSISFGDALSVVEGADVAAAFSWVNEALSVAAQKGMVRASSAVPSVEDAFLPDLYPDLYAQLTIDEILREAPVQAGIPVESDGDLVTVDEMTAAWDDYKAGFG